MSSKKPKPGDMVVLTKIPQGFLDDLPPEDQQAISTVVGKPVLLNQYDREGRAELEFTDTDGGVHFVYVNPDLITIAE